MLAITVTMACQIVGSLLIFTLLIGPAAISLQWCDDFYPSIILSIIVSTTTIWSSLTLAFYANLPISSCATSIICCLYVMGKMKNFIKGSI